MPDFTPPEDLIDLKARWYAADALAKQIADEEPAEPADEQDRAARTIISNPRNAAEQPTAILLPTEEQMARLEKARETLRAVTLEIFRHPWKSQQDDVHLAEKALNEVALERYQASLAA